jgi:hypothetical protein
VLLSIALNRTTAAALAVTANHKLKEKNLEEEGWL